MAARSSEALAGQKFRAEHAVYPKANKYLRNLQNGEEICAIWDELIRSKPVEYWNCGNLILFEQFCIMVYKMRLATIAVELAGDTQSGLHSEQTSAEFNALMRCTTLVMRLADKLRLSPQSNIDADDDADRNSKGSTTTFLLGGKTEKFNSLKVVA